MLAGTARNCWKPWDFTLQTGRFPASCFPRILEIVAQCSIIVIPIGCGIYQLLLFSGVQCFLLIERRFGPLVDHVREKKTQEDPRPWDGASCSFQKVVILQHELFIVFQHVKLQNLEKSDVHSPRWIQKRRPRLDPEGFTMKPLAAPRPSGC